MDIGRSYQTTFSTVPPLMHDIFVNAYGGSSRVVGEPA
jgi:hypothetical protein